MDINKLDGVLKTRETSGVSSEHIDLMGLFKSLEEVFGALWRERTGEVIPHWESKPISEWGVGEYCITYRDLAKWIKGRWNKIQKKEKRKQMKKK